MSTILVMDDQPSNRQLLAALLGYRGHRVLEAADGLAGLALTRAERPDLVIADVLMPVMDGYQFVKLVREEAAIASTPVMFYTANYLEGEARQLASACGVGIVLRKPSEPDAILRAVDEALAGQPSTTPSAPPAFAHSHVRLLTDKLAEKVEQLEAASARLTALIHLGQALASEPDLEKLLVLFAKEARKLMDARCAAVGIFADSGLELRHFLIDGGDGVGEHLPAPREGVFAELLAAAGPLRTSRLELEQAAVLPSTHREPSGFLGVAVSTAAQEYGWIYFLDKVGSEGFSVADEGVAALLASQLGLAYENAGRLDRIRQHAVELERRVADRTEALTQSNEELEQFAYVASHDLQEPLRTVAAFMQLVSRRYGDRLDDQGREFVDFAVKGATRMQQLIDDLLALSRVGRHSRAVAPTSAQAALDGALQHLHAAMATTGATVTQGPLPVVWADPLELEQLFANLLGNALKFHGTDPPSIHVRADCDARGWVFSVRDNGIGIDTRHFDRIFEVFQRLHGPGEYAGTGIGLAICKKIATRLGGRLWVESTPGHGATFFFVVPDVGGVGSLGHDEDGPPQ